MTDPLGHYLYMTIGIIRSQGEGLFKKKYLYFGNNKKIRKWTTGSFGQTPPPLSELPVHKKVLFSHLSLNVFEEKIR